MYSPLYVDLDGLFDDTAVRFYSSDDDGINLRTLIPIGAAGPTGTYMSGLRSLNVPLASGDFELPAGTTITMRLYYRSVENDTFGDIVPMPASASDGEDARA